MRVDGDDIWDPNNWIEDEHECRIYGADDLGVYAVVDWIDYIALVQHRWSVHAVKGKPQLYLRRGVSEFFASDGEPFESPITGKLVRNRKRVQSNLFLHTAIVLRAKLEPPSPEHTIIDHKDRNTMNCRRINLHWATHKMNSQNRLVNGRWAK